MLKRPLVLVAVLIACTVAPAARAMGEAPLAEGDWIQVKGTFVNGVFRAQEIERVEDTSFSVKGPVGGLDLEGGEIRFGTLSLVVNERTRFEDLDGNETEASAFRHGDRVKVSARRRDEGGFRARRVRRLEASESPRIRLEGQVELLTHLENETYLRLLGIEIRADSRTAWSDIARPRYIVDDEDFRPGRGIGLGRWGQLSGEIRFDLKGEHNFILSDAIEADEATGRLRGRVEWIFPTTRRFSGMLQVKGEAEREIVDEDDNIEDESKVTLGRAYLMFHNVLGKRGSVQVGRSRFDDKRDWLFNRDIDAVRLIFDWSRVRLEAAVAEEIIDPVPRHEDVLNTYVAMTYYPGRRHALTAYVIDRDDEFVVSGNARDFSPRLQGLRAEGDGKHWEYWLDGALGRGRDRGVPIEAHAFDAGFTWILPGRIEPSLTLGYAMGSGDDDPFDGVSGTFRQTGLHLNNGKFNGVSSFRYYGELMRPELANLHVQTYGIGFRPKRKVSIDLVYHRYELDQPASELVDAAMDDRTLNLVDLDVGSEWDLVFGHEEREHWEFEIDLGWFIPGDAFLGPTDEAASLRFKAKYIF